MRSGRTDHVLALVDRARPLLRDDADRAELALLHGSCELERGALTEAFGLLTDGARRTLADDPVTALRMLHRAGEASWWAGDPAWSDEVAALATRIAAGDGARVHPRAARRQRAAPARRLRGRRGRAARRRGARRRGT